MDAHDGPGGRPSTRVRAAARLDAGTLAALDRALRLHWRAVFARCRLLATSDTDASALACSAFHHASRERPVREPADVPRERLVAIATDLWRTTNGLPTSAEAATRTPVVSPVVIERGSTAAVPSERRGTAARERDPLLTLSPRLRDVLIARYVDAEPVPRIARRYEVPAERVVAWLHQAAACIDGVNARDRAGEPA